MFALLQAGTASPWDVRLRLDMSIYEVLTTLSALCSMGLAEMTMVDGVPIYAAKDQSDD